LTDFQNPQQDPNTQRNMLLAFLLSVSHHCRFPAADERNTGPSHPSPSPSPLPSPPHSQRAHLKPPPEAQSKNAPALRYACGNQASGNRIRDWSSKNDLYKIRFTNSWRLGEIVGLEEVRR